MRLKNHKRWIEWKSRRCISTLTSIKYGNENIENLSITGYSNIFWVCMSPMWSGCSEKPWKRPPTLSVEAKVGFDYFFGWDKGWCEYFKHRIFLILVKSERHSSSRSGCKR